ncbi:MAG TPA: hypothetical protein VJP88_06795 [Caulobacteraceae bacterium]|nr:hypothetical protein [Caulobacteraceae bacterium]
MQRANIAAQYKTQPVFKEAQLLFRTDASWHSKERTIGQTSIPPQFESVAFSPASWVLNARVALQHIKLPEGNMEVALWAKNLNDNGTMMFPINFFYLASTTYQPARRSAST